MWLLASQTGLRVEHWTKCIVESVRDADLDPDLLVHATLFCGIAGYSRTRTRRLFRRFPAGLDTYCICCWTRNPAERQELSFQWFEIGLPLPALFHVYRVWNDHKQHKVRCNRARIGPEHSFLKTWSFGTDRENPGKLVPNSYFCFGKSKKKKKKVMFFGNLFVLHSDFFAFGVTQKGDFTFGSFCQTTKLAWEQLEGTWINRTQRVNHKFEQKNLSSHHMSIAFNDLTGCSPLLLLYPWPKCYPQGASHPHQNVTPSNQNVTHVSRISTRPNIVQFVIWPLISVVIFNSGDGAGLKFCCHKIVMPKQMVHPCPHFPDNREIHVRRVMSVWKAELTNSFYLCAIFIPGFSEVEALCLRYLQETSFEEQTWQPLCLFQLLTKDDLGNMQKLSSTSWRNK